MADLRYPALYQINTRVWLTALSQKLGRRATLDDIPDAELDRLAALGSDWIWFLSVWQTGPAAQAISRANAEWRKDFQRRFPQRKIDQHLWVFQRSSRVLGDHREIPQPRNSLARLVESSFPQDRVVAALVEMHDKPFRLDFDHTRCFHEFAVQLFGRSGVKASQLLGQPAIATIGQYGHGGVKIYIESHLTRQTIKVKAMHADPQPVLDAIAAGVTHNQRPRTLLGVVG
jgi:hypothetical protein